MLAGGNNMNSVDLAQGLMKNCSDISSIDGVPRFDSCMSANTVFVLTQLKWLLGYVSSLVNKIDVADGIQY
jgi:hypothetical protein